MLVLAAAGLKFAPLTLNPTLYAPGSLPVLPNTRFCPWLIGCPLTVHWWFSWFALAPDTAGVT